MINSLYIGKSSLTTSKYAVDTTSNNIANQNTQGYKKRVVGLSEIELGDGIVGNGVTISGITRTTNQYLYQQLLTQNSLAAYYEQESSILSNAETIFSETEESGFSITLNNYFSALETFRSEPNSLVNQNEYETQTNLLVDGIKSLYTDLEDEQTSLKKELNDQVDSVNNILEQIVYINEKIQNSSTVSNDLLDKRDALEKELSSYGNIEIDTTNSSYSLKIGGETAIFNGTNLYELSVQESYTSQKDIYDTTAFDDSNVNDSDTITITLNNTTTISFGANVSSSSDKNDLKNQIIDAINNSSDFNDIEAYLDTSNNLIIKSKKSGEESKFDLNISINSTQIEKSDTSQKRENSVYVAIYDDTLSLSGGTLKSLSQNLTTSTSKISSYKQSLDDFVNSFVKANNSNSSVKLFDGSSVETFKYVKNSINDLTSDDLEKLAQIQWSEDYNIDSQSEDMSSFTDFYKNLLVSISSNTENINFKLDTQSSIVNSLTTTFDDLTKVDTDEEMINLLQYQASYEASAKVITAVDEMIQTLLNM